MRRPGNPEPLSLVAGLVLVVFGAVLLLDAAGEINLSFGAMAPIAFAAIGVILVASGLSRGGGS